jgi:hypothetical protein
MKATKPGQVIGKALEDFDGLGYKKIMTFINVSFADPNSSLTGINTDINGNINIGNVSSDNIILPQGIVIAGKEVNGSLTNAISSIGENLNNIKSQVTNVEQTVLAANTKISNLDLRVSNIEQAQASGSADLKDTREKLTETSQATNILSEKIASQEAMLKNLQALNSNTQNYNIASIQELGLNHMDINTATISSTLYVLGRTTLSDLGVTGSISTGVLTIKGLNEDATASINTLSGDLKLQNEGFGGIDILTGKIKIDINGNINILNSLTAKEVNTGKLNITNNADTAALSASAGIGTMVKDTDTLIIKTTAVTKDSLIYVTFSGDYRPAIRYWIDNKTVSKSFTVKLDAEVANDVKLNWWIVN